MVYFPAAKLALGGIHETWKERIVPATVKQIRFLREGSPSQRLALEVGRLDQAVNRHAIGTYIVTRSGTYFDRSGSPYAAAMQPGDDAAVLMKPTEQNPLR